MDSRIREIEQWVAEAREGLSDGGREAYLCKLYLLEAEIRAVIKENGMLPQGVSPRPEERRVRRSATSALAFGMTAALAGVCVLAATTFYFVRNADTRPNRYQTVPQRLASVESAVAPESIPPTRKALAVILAERGEELLPDSWPSETGASFVGDPGAPVLASSQPAAAQNKPADKKPATGKPIPLILAAKPAGTAPGTKPAGRQPARAGAQDSGGATDVILLAGSPAAADTVHEPKLKTGKGTGSMPSSGFNDRGFVSKALAFPEGLAPPVKGLKNATKAKIDKMTHDKSGHEGEVADVVVDSETGDDAADDASSEAGSAGSADKAVDKSGDEESQDGEQSGDKS